MFSFNDEKPSAGVIPSNSEANPTGAGSVSAHTVNAAREAAEQGLAVSPRKRGRPRKDAATSGVDSGTLQNQINAQIAAQLDAVHDPKAWGALLAMPADAAKTWTGNERWELAKEERETLGMTGSAFARTLMITNPKSLAMLMLASALFSVYVPRTLAQLREMREEQEKNAKKSSD